VALASKGLDSGMPVVTLISVVLLSLRLLHSGLPLKRYGLPQKSGASAYSEPHPSTIQETFEFYP
jgi:hypothetical protein